MEVPRQNVGAFHWCVSDEVVKWWLVGRVNQQSNQPEDTHPSHPQRVVPRCRAEGGAVRSHAQTADAVLVSVQDVESGSLQHVPYIDGVVIVASEQQASYRERKIYFFYPQDIFMGFLSLYSRLESVWERQDMSGVERHRSGLWVRIKYGFPVWWYSSLAHQGMALPQRGNDWSMLSTPNSSSPSMWGCITFSSTYMRGVFPLSLAVFIQIVHNLYWTSSVTLWHNIMKFSIYVKMK